MKELLWKHILTVREKSPLVQNITNYVAMNNTANALLAVGASPIMAHARSELKQMVGICQSLVINIGTLDEYWTESMLVAAEVANKSGKFWVLDPVGAGATSYRDEVIGKLLNLRPTVIRGNASEILAVAKQNKVHTKGVDSTDESHNALGAAQFLNRTLGSVVCISGKTDIIVDDHQQILLSNGDPMMTKVTGLGCSATAVIGAFIAVVENHTEAVAAAMALFGIAGEIASENIPGPGTLQVQLLDTLYNLTAAEFMDRLKISVK